MTAILSVAQQCLGYIKTIQITDLIDIGILAYVIYRVLLLARNSNTGQVLKGIGFLVGVMWVSSLLNLHVISFLLSNALELGFLALVVVFQPEIRHFLEQMGTRGLSSMFSRSDTRLDYADETEAAINELVDAYTTMSKNKVGALTVFERDSILDDCIKSGTALDAEVNSELLKNIFWPKAPLHDGAVIIRGGRIVGGGCVLPLSSNTSISRELGTRHRAGIGVTEHTDAVVAIVSEETGSISVAVGGSLKRHLAPETLRRLLRNELLPQALEDEESSLNWKGLLRSLNSLRLTDLVRHRKEDSDHAE